MATTAKTVPDLVNHVDALYSTGFPEGVEWKNHVLSLLEWDITQPVDTARLRGQSKHLTRDQRTELLSTPMCALPPSVVLDVPQFCGHHFVAHHQVQICNVGSVGNNLIAGGPHSKQTRPLTLATVLMAIARTYKRYPHTPEGEQEDDCCAQWVGPGTWFGGLWGDVDRDGLYYVVLRRTRQPLA